MPEDDLGAQEALAQGPGGTAQDQAHADARGEVGDVVAPPHEATDQRVVADIPHVQLHAVGAREVLPPSGRKVVQDDDLDAGEQGALDQGEIRYAAEFLRFFAAEARRDLGEVIAPHMPGKRLFTVRQPVGVAALITIWNFPVAGVTRPAGAALAAGCTVVLKPPEQTPLSAIAVAEIFDDAGLPPGVLNVVPTNAPETVGAELLSHPGVRKVSFTGSVEVGRHVAERAARDLKRVTLELGGHAPLIVFDDADVQSAVEAAVLSKFRNNGQTCITVNRIFVHESLVETFYRALHRPREPARARGSARRARGRGPAHRRGGVAKGAGARR